MSLCKGQSLILSPERSAVIKKNNLSLNVSLIPKRIHPLNVIFMPEQEASKGGCFKGGRSYKGVYSHPLFRGKEGMGGRILEVVDPRAVDDSCVKI